MMRFEEFQDQLCAQQECSACAVFGTSDRLGGAVLCPTACFPESVGLAYKCSELTSQHVGGERIAVSFPDRNLIGFHHCQPFINSKQKMKTCEANWI